ncbi:tannase/feruloyl esterase family alpha/beta hydrolase [Variovorax sp. LjRoot84]|uniref:tannase/feruloyl esterase family alpha/beta hydrolase n=1 Tax=Variovorax sp. LjRoot84 TaxID=3342340 RepID=UPI003F5143F4
MTTRVHPGPGVQDARPVGIEDEPRFRGHIDGPRTASPQRAVRSAFTQAEMNTVANAVLARCDALDGAADGMVADVQMCKQAFDLATAVPTCGGARRQLPHGRAKERARQRLLRREEQRGHGDLQQLSLRCRHQPCRLAPVGVLQFAKPGYRCGRLRFQHPAAGTEPPVRHRFRARIQHGHRCAEHLREHCALHRVIDVLHDAAEPEQPSALRARGSKLIVYHGTSDAVFSSDDTTSWYEQLRAANGGDASGFARFFPVPGMNHCGRGPATDQFDMLTPLVAWVEQGKAPTAIIAAARGAGANVVNTELTADWSADRTRPLCPYPKTAAYVGDSVESASSFACR